jgi:CxxC motif-containing protein (DUF1111 family)
VEMGITNELFQNEREENPSCQFAAVPNDVTNTDGATPLEVISTIEKFAFFMRFLDAPDPSETRPGGAASITSGKRLFSDVGCALCHTPSFTTGNSTVAALRNKPVNLFSDLLVHDMGVGLADGVSQGEAGPREFRSAPLWGLGQRIFFLHDGRTSNLARAQSRPQQHQGARARRLGGIRSERLSRRDRALAADAAADFGAIQAGQVGAGQRRRRAKAHGGGKAVRLPRAALT